MGWKIPVLVEPYKNKEVLKDLDSNNPMGIYYKYYRDFVTTLNDQLKLNSILDNPLDTIDVTNAIIDVFVDSSVASDLKQRLILRMIDQWNDSSEFKISYPAEQHGMQVDNLTLEFNY